MQDWLKWNALKWQLRLDSWFGGIKRKANDDIDSYDHSSSAGGANDALPNEVEYAAQFYELGKVSQEKIGLINKIIFFLGLSIVLMGLQVIKGEPDWQNNPYQAYWAMAGVFSLFLVLLFVWTFIKNTKHYEDVSELEYQEAQDWLYWMGEKSYRPMQIWKKLIIILGLGLEAYAIGIVIASVATGGQITESVANIVGMAIGAGLAVLLAFTSHQGGVQLFISRKRRSINATISKQKKKQGNASNMFDVLSQQEPDFEESFLSRITWFQRFGFVFISLILSVLIGGAAFYERAKLNIINIEQNSTNMGEFDPMKGIDMAEFQPLPPELAQKQAIASEELNAAIKNDEMNGIYAALAILFMLLVGMNGLGILFGYQHAFAHKRSEDSWHKIKAYNSRRNRNYQNQKDELVGWGSVIAAANKLFKRYHSLLIKISKEQGEEEVLSVLQKRKAYRMESYIEEQEVVR